MNELEEFTGYVDECADDIERNNYQEAESSLKKAYEIASKHYQEKIKLLKSEKDSELTRKIQEARKFAKGLNELNELSNDITKIIINNIQGGN